MFSSWMNLALMNAEAQRVIWLRLMKMGAGGPDAIIEGQRMIVEKMAAAAVAGVRVAAGEKPDRVMAPYRKRVRANLRRLSR